MRCIYVDFFLPRWPVTIFSDLRNKKISSSDQSILSLGDVSNTSSTSSVKIITSPKCKIISVIDVSSSDGSSNYGSSLSISTLTISTKVRMPPSSMKGKRESNENASNMSDLDTSSEEEDSYANLAPAKRSRILEEFTRLMGLSSQKQWGAGSKHSTGNGWEGGRQREKKNLQRLAYCWTAIAPVFVSAPAHSVSETKSGPSNPASGDSRKQSPSTTTPTSTIQWRVSTCCLLTSATHQLRNCQLG